MKPKSGRLRRWSCAGAIVLGPLLTACTGDASDGAEAGPDAPNTTGSEGGPCFSNGTCNAGLSCTLMGAKGVCEPVDASMLDAAPDSGSKDAASDGDGPVYTKSDACIQNPTNEPYMSCDSSETYASYLCPSGTEPTVQEQVWVETDAAGYYPGYICCTTFPAPDAGSGVWWCCDAIAPNNDPYPCQ
jgi:hypothetical protein